MRPYLTAVRRQASVVLLATLVTVGVALAASYLKAPRFEGRAEIVESPPRWLPDARAKPSDPPSELSRWVQTEMRVVTSAEVLARARTRLGFAPHVSARQIGQTNVIEVTVEAGTRGRARAAAEQYAAAYVDFRRDQAAEDLLAGSRDVDAQLGQLSARIDQAGSAEKAALVQLYTNIDALQSRLQVDAATALEQARVVSPTSKETTPVKLAVRATGAAAGVVGLVLGIDFALLFHFLDESIRTGADLAAASGGLPMLGTVPAVASPTTLAVQPGSSSPEAEAYRSLKTVLQATDRGRSPDLVQVTSAGSREGKTTTVANLGLALLEGVDRVVLVDSDLRKPRLHEVFGLPNAVGVASVLSRTVPLTAALQEIPGRPGLRLLASGPLPPNPAELLSSTRMADLLQEVARDSDIVLVDSPPVLPVSDAVVMSRMVGATVVLAACGRTTRRELGRAVHLLRQVDAHVVGVVLHGSTEDLGPVAVRSGRQLIGS